MVRSSFLRLAAAAALALGLACSEPYGGALPPADAYVTVGNNFFMPQLVTIRAGQTVLWLWGGGANHDVVVNGAGAPPGCSLANVGFCTRQFPTAGTFNYYCTPHGSEGMVGTIQVDP